MRLYPRGNLGECQRERTVLRLAQRVSLGLNYLKELILVKEGAISLLLLLLLLVPVSASAKDLGELSANPYQQNSTANPYGAGSPYALNGINNPYSPFGSPFSNQSARNPFATDAPRLYDQ